ncbi:conserved hypothetical protein [Vibrio nigripulchritudo SFn27]|uniref:Uncharacterized protein n=1 Tax=Vibrio nigripulchritudo TaxID=28173 RepID=U4KI37_9VIBR|nr:hypothetical protein [Vibrio nigripulchritudo]CCN84034.1 conserved hypothetical protein [Vibrio nigripulchritudo BLFn1]CCN89296.1 conserved hypothetical protein [Vibrio nigripulchritudo SFn27]CCN93049.1 conserved hypothetical protein [Vibrio nigripulchritudo ENn2]CCO40420.1 conserved hypothetical protein [Vibrio nigripulchritudo SFn135]CCO55707.1 conserved hypothetical protein [Vibrio nigripulchritudo Wn13]
MNTVLISSAFMSFTAAFLHGCIVLGGPDWYRFFGAGEAMAQMAEEGRWYPLLVTAAIGTVLATWGVFALSGAGLVFPLPWTKWVLLGITLVYLARGVLGIVAVNFIDHPYFIELRAQQTFMWVSSVICTVIGITHAVGLYQVWSKLN